MLERLDNRRRRGTEWNSPFAEAAIGENLNGLGLENAGSSKVPNWHLKTGRDAVTFRTASTNEVVADCDHLVYGYKS